MEVAKMGMNINLTEKLEEMVRNKVSSGLYNSASEVVRDALRLMQEQDTYRAVRLGQLQQEIQRGLESGPSEPLDMADLKQRLRTEKSRKNKVAA
jgi:antitoxin ParD1/3/4